MVRGNGKVENYYAAPLSWLHCAAFGPRMPHAPCSTRCTLHTTLLHVVCATRISCHMQISLLLQVAVAAFFPSDLQSG